MPALSGSRTPRRFGGLTWLSAIALGLSGAFWLVQLFVNPQVFIGTRSQLNAVTGAVWFYHGHERLPSKSALAQPGSPALLGFSLNPNRRSPWRDIANMPWLPVVSRGLGFDGASEIAVCFPLWIPIALFGALSAWFNRGALSLFGFRLFGGTGRYCVLCRYDLVGLPFGSTCPECGLVRARARMSRAGKRGAMVWLALASITFGSLTTLGVAWIPLLIFNVPDPADARDPDRLRAWPHPHHPKRIFVFGRRTTTWWCTRETALFNDLWGGTEVGATLTGYPARCLSMFDDHSIELFVSGRGTSQTYDTFHLTNRWVRADLPLRPLWLGLCFNILFWSGIFGAACLALKLAHRFSRRWFRRWAGRCRTCALDLRSLKLPPATPCPECGEVRTE